MDLEVAAIAINNREHGYQGVESVKKTDTEIIKLLKKERTRSQGLGYLILETCSRFEIYLSGSEERLNDLLIGLRRGVRDLVSIDPKIYRDRDLLNHMLKVLSGAESLAPFEIDIVNQTRASMAKALSEGSLDKHLNAIFREAIEASIDIRRSLDISGSIGIPEVAVMMARDILGSLSSKKAVIIGTGEVARRIANMLRSEGVSIASIVGRSYHSAEAIARIFPSGKAYLINEISRAINGNDLVFLATSARDPIVSLKDIEASSDGVFIDLGNPRNVDPSARDLLGDRYIWLEDLEIFSRKILPDLYEKLEDLDKIIQPYLRRLEARLVLESIRLGLDNYARLLESIRRGEVERAVSAFKLDQGQREVLDLVTTSILNKALGALASLIEDRTTRRSFTNG
ncbi:MAG TPA: NAD(P)-binding domain-containing protein [Sulfolobales archaeon]|nr:NAD(P)-binding domain-containing protein [Sulfolobales archaeon]